MVYEEEPSLDIVLQQEAVLFKRPVELLVGVEGGQAVGHQRSRPHLEFVLSLLPGLLRLVPRTRLLQEVCGRRLPRPAECSKDSRSRRLEYIPNIYS